MWWWAPVIPGTQEAEAGELPGLRRWRLQWAKIMPLHSSLGHKERDSVSKQQQQQQQTKQNKTRNLQVVPCFNITFIEHLYFRGGPYLEDNGIVTIKLF